MLSCTECRLFIAQEFSSGKKRFPRGEETRSARRGKEHGGIRLSRPRIDRFDSSELFLVYPRARLQARKRAGEQLQARKERETSFTSSEVGR